MQKLLAANPLPDAVSCFNGPVAIGAMKAIYEAGLRVPKNIVLIGAGVVAFAGEYRNALTDFFAITDKLYERAKKEGEAF